MNSVTLVGDVHGKYDKYFKICKENEYTIQLGDTGFNNDRLSVLDPCKHKFFTGNHNDHDKDYDLPHSLGRFGYSELNNTKFFFVAGGFSIDKIYRMRAYYSGSAPQTYFFNEELSYSESCECLSLYEKIKPDLVLTHEAPRSITNELFDSDKLRNFGFDPKTFTTSTSELLQQMLEMHTPSTWCFGHHHQSKGIFTNGCYFRCIKELEVVKI